jgi:hypothetical protein
MRIVLIIMSEAEDSVNPKIPGIFFAVNVHKKEGALVTRRDIPYAGLKLCNHFSWLKKPLKIIKQNQ